MVCVKWVVCLVMALTLGGCAVTREIRPSVAYEEGYQKGLKEKAAVEVGAFNGNAFPYLAGRNWSQPLVQEVLIPAHIQGGVFYPEHKELVIITPGEWQKSGGGYPLRVNGVPEPGRVEMLAADITALPIWSNNERLKK